MNDWTTSNGLKEVAVLKSTPDTPFKVSMNEIERRTDQVPNNRDEPGELRGGVIYARRRCRPKGYHFASGRGNANTS
ncbi:MAG: hypothetical protein J4N27_04615, partial [Chloroflexi bacterium]|nr:hypothetical protein [Chloroflexota bacterium]